MRIIKTFILPSTKNIPAIGVSVYWNNEWEEFICKPKIFRDGRMVDYGSTDGWNHTDDKQDAFATAKAMLIETRDHYIWDGKKPKVAKPLPLKKKKVYNHKGEIVQIMWGY